MTGDETMWIGPDETLSVGMTGFLINHSNQTKGWKRYELRDLPAHTNGSNEPRLYGWCGSYNDIGTFGCGVARVERLARNGRVLVRKLDGADALAVLEELGYPELAKELEASK